MSIPLPALTIHQQQTSPIETYGQVLGIRSLLDQQRTRQLQQTGLEQENQQRALQMQAQQRQFQEAQAYRDTYSGLAKKMPNATQSDLIDATVKELSSNPIVSPSTLQALQLHSQDLRSKTAAADEATLKLRATQIDNLRGAFKPVYDAPDEQKPALWQQQLQATRANPQAYGDTSHLPQQFPGKEAGELMMQSMTGIARQVQEAQEARTAAKTTAETRGATAEAGIKEAQLKAMQGGGAAGAGLDVQEANAWLKKNPGKDLADYAKYKATLVPAFNFNLQTQGVGTPAAAGGGGINAVAPNIRPTVQAVLEGRQAPPGGFALKTPYWQNVMNNVYAVDPQWSEQRAQLRKAYTTGSQSKEINAINTALGHVGALGDAIDALGNNNVQVLNRIANAYGVQVGQTPVTTLQTIVNRVGPELVKAYAGTAGGEAERQRVEADFSPKMSPAQLKTNVATTAKLLRSKIASLENQWNQNAAPGMQGFQDRFIMPAAKAVVDKLAPESQNAGAMPTTAEDFLKKHGQR